jgi:hypothetical protein
MKTETSIDYFLRIIEFVELQNCFIIIVITFYNPICDIRLVVVSISSS